MASAQMSSGLTTTHWATEESFSGEMFGAVSMDKDEFFPAHQMLAVEPDSPAMGTPGPFPTFHDQAIHKPRTSQPSASLGTRSTVLPEQATGGASWVPLSPIGTTNSEQALVLLERHHSSDAADDEASDENGSDTGPKPGTNLMSPIAFRQSETVPQYYTSPQDGGVSLLEEDEQYFANMVRRGERLSLEDEAYYASLRIHLAKKADERYEARAGGTVRFGGVGEPKGRSKGTGKRERGRGSIVFGAAREQSVPSDGEDKENEDAEMDYADDINVAVATVNTPRDAAVEMVAGRPKRGVARKATDLDDKKKGPVLRDSKNIRKTKTYGKRGCGRTMTLGADMMSTKDGQVSGRGSKAGFGGVGKRHPGRPKKSEQADAITKHSADPAPKAPSTDAHGNPLMMLEYRGRLGRVRKQ
ncbi:hypothetical protein CAC42_6058 [Sphaceloma murrayae]|uniref:Uncharacterized protein n=1 Tax=Sphaceloma murrayae TaxID=2082308 RepID=A0A2K1QVQ1_9PEZI|nr:hypothetical protein CAC42_6058 [Sphaceloma murrayae]